MSTKKYPAAYRVFHFYYKCYIPQHFLYSQDFIDTFGLPTSEDRAVDRELAYSPVLSRLTISEMALHLDQGAVITLYEPNRSVTIYQTIREHLQDWELKVQSGMTNREPPLEDLRMLDALATELYKVARGYLEKEGDHTSIGALFNNRKKQGITRHSQEEVKRRRQEALPEKHTSITDKIAKIGFDRRR